MKRVSQVLLIAAAALALECRADGPADAAIASPVPESFRDVQTIVQHDGRPEAAGRPVRMMAQVAYISALADDTCVVVNPERPWEQGVVMAVPDSAALDDGDIVIVNGKTTFDGHHLCVRATDATRVRNEPLPKARTSKFADLRLGKLHARRASFVGSISDIFVTERENGRLMTRFRLNFDKSRAICRVPGRLPGRYKSGGDVRVTGCAFNVYNEQGVVVGAYLELEGQSAIEVLSTIYWWRVGAVTLAVIAGFLVIVLLAGWIRLRRVSIAERAVAVDRQRMAADLHDTSEQHLAGVKILLTCALKPAGVPEETKKVLEKAAAMLIHAKGEVRSTIMNLRSAGLEGKGFEEQVKEMAAPLRHGGIAVKILLRGLPDKMDSARHGDLLLIAREAVTNAIKHGKAKTVVIVSDPLEGGAGFVLKVLNDGAPFDVNAALGPETGHFGLAGMRERALRSGFTLDFGKDGDWTAVRVEVPT